jgi:hypothetical protein
MLVVSSGREFHTTYSQSMSFPYSPGENPGREYQPGCAPKARSTPLQPVFIPRIEWILSGRSVKRLYFSLRVVLVSKSLQLR